MNSAELDAVVESYIIFLKQIVNLALTKEQVVFHSYFSLGDVF
jgi:hypothetical protein